jgi:O-antigen ligase/polysaccharide polymerase Wzy-like membrane protein
VLAAAIPILFLHVRYQPDLRISAGSTTIDAYLSDFAVLAVVVAALAEARRRGLGPLAAGRALWVAGALFLVWAGAGVAYGRLHASSYPWQTHGVTAAKFAEYALLAPAVPLLVRRSRDLLLPVWSAALWSTAATVVGIAQFFGAGIFLSGTVGRRQASFLSSADFAALSAGALLVGVVAIAMPQLAGARVPAAIATASGTLGMIVAGAIASVLGLATALATLVVVLALRRELVPRRILLVGGVSLVVLAGAVAIRGSDLDAFARFLGASPGTSTAPPAKVQTYAHRTLLAWIGYEIWTDHPVIGVGWEGSSEPANFVPYLPAAHRRFPDESPLAFPSAAPDRRYGVQNSWVQALADLGVIGFVLWVAVFAAAAWTAMRALGTVAALYGLLATALLAWLWTAQGFVAGIPLDALTFLAFGATATRVAAE